MMLRRDESQKQYLLLSSLVFPPGCLYTLRLLTLTEGYQQRRELGEPHARRKRLKEQSEENLTRPTNSPFLKAKFGFHKS